VTSIIAALNRLAEHTVPLGTMNVVGNSTATTISTQNTYVDFALNALAAVGADNVDFTVTNTTTGEIRYDGTPDVTLVIFGSIGVSTPGSQNYEIQALKNGSVLPDGIITPVNTDSTSNSVPFLSTVTLVTNDLIRFQIQNIDGTDDVTIIDLSVVIKP